MVRSTSAVPLMKGGLWLDWWFGHSSGSDTGMQCNVLYCGMFHMFWNYLCFSSQNATRGFPLCQVSVALGSGLLPRPRRQGTLTLEWAWQGCHLHIMRTGESMGR
ncbi:unnamed protein product [Arctogadus glacialis]